MIKFLFSFVMINLLLYLTWIIYYNTSFHRNDDLQFKKFVRHDVVPDEVLREYGELE